MKKRKLKLAPVPTSRAKTAYGLLSEVRRLILAEPKRYSQGTWLQRAASTTPDLMPVGGFPSCGTVGCVAGWVATLKRPRRWFNPLVSGLIARRVLGLSEDQADLLFDGDAAYQRNPDADSQTAAHARAGAAHIYSFQKKFATQLRAKRLT